MFEPLDRDGAAASRRLRRARARSRAAGRDHPAQGRARSACPATGPRRAVRLRAAAVRHASARTLLGGPRRRRRCRATSCATRSAQGLVLRAARSARTRSRSASSPAPTRTSARRAPSTSARSQGHGGAGSNARVELPTGLRRQRLSSTPAASRCCGPRRTRATRCSPRMRRREAYGTSGPRIVVRFFGGCELPDEPVRRRATSSSRATRSGVPMGGELGPADGQRRAALRGLGAARSGHGRRAGRAARSACRSSRAGSTDGDAALRRCSTSPAAPSDASVDLATCTPHGHGRRRALPVWRDPRLRPGAARLLLRARARESELPLADARLCRAAGVDCEQPGRVPDGYEGCCAGYPETHQERAWSSPIFYRPERSAD